MFFCSNRFISSESAAVFPIEPSTTSTAISVPSSTCLAFSIRISPRLPSSSMPGVSIITTGPSGNSSIAFITGSVVVPLISDTTDKFCPVTAFTRLDFPALRLPKNAICTLSASGVSLSPISTS